MSSQQAQYARKGTTKEEAVDPATASSAVCAPTPNAQPLTLWPNTAKSVGLARRDLGARLAEWGLPELREPAQLVLSELFTNAVRHARAPRGRDVGTRYERVPGGVRIEVHDAGDARPVRRAAAVDAEAGRGLALVEALTGARWGVSDRTGVGKLVWAVVTHLPENPVTELAQPWGLSRMRPFPESAVVPAGRVELDAWTQTGRWVGEDGAAVPVLDRHKRSETSKETSTRTSLDGNSDAGSDQEGDSD
jgi:putative ATP-grasp target RiPP